MVEGEEVTANSWVNKQLWRVKQTYIVFQPMANIVQLLLWIIIAIGVNEWFTLTWEMFALATIGVILTLNLIGYGFDKKGFFIEHANRQFKIALPVVANNQMNYSAILIAKYMKMGLGPLEELTTFYAKELGIEL